MIYPTNSKGQICGRGDNANKPYLLFFDLTRCLNPAVLALGCRTTQVCVSQCPQEKYSGVLDLQYRSSEAVKETLKPFCANMTQSRWDRLTARQLIEDELCPAWLLPSTPILGRCLPTLIEIDKGNPDNPNATLFGQNATLGGETVKEGTVMSAVRALSGFLEIRSFGEKVWTDIADTYQIILGAYLVAAIVSFLWIVLMRFIAGVMVWTSVGLSLSIFGGLFGYCLYRYLIIKDIPDAQDNIFMVNFTPDYGQRVLELADTWLAFTIIIGIIFLFILLMLIALRQRILIAIELIEQASVAVAQMFSTLVFPILPWALESFFFLFFAAIALYLSSAGVATYQIVYEVSNVTTRTAAPPPNPCTNPCFNELTNQTFELGDICYPEPFIQSCPNCPQVQCQFVKYVKNSESAAWMQWYNLFGLYWGVAFAHALGEMILAGVFALWYWTWDKKNVPCCALSRSIFNTFVFHLGTVAFGSLIIAIIKMLRTILSYVEDKLKKYNNDLTRCLICMCKCCLWCLEKFMKFINRNAYIVCAIKGTNFCVSAKEAFSLLMRNIVRVVVLNKIVDFLLFLGKLVVTAGVGCLAYFVFSGSIPWVKDEIPNLNFLATPIVVTVLGTYFIAAAFFGVYEMAVDTLFLCFLEDLERNDGTQERPYFMSRSLQKVVGKMQQFNDDRD